MPGGNYQKSIQRCWCCAPLVVCAFLATGFASNVCAQGIFSASKPSDETGTSSRVQRDAAIASLPLKRLTQTAQQEILSIAQSPTIYRRLPTQAIDCDQEMFLFLSRNPEVLVGIWDLMGITQVQINRTGPYRLEAEDGSGTTCVIDLVYGDPTMHIFVARGSYDGKLVAKPIQGSGVFILTSRYSRTADQRTSVTGTLDCFIQLDSLGADLVARSLSGLIGRSADNNYVETSRFISQVSQASERNPASMLDVAARLPQVPEPTRLQFAERISAVARRASASQRYARTVTPAAK